MSRWVKQKYEGALAFLFIAFAAIIPWNFSIANTGEFGNVYAFRWWIGELLFIPAIEELSGWYWVNNAILMQEGHTVFEGYIIWGVSTALFIITLVFAAALFIREQDIQERLPLPIRKVAGGLLLTTGLLYLSASMWISAYGIPGTYVPIGALFNMLFGGILLTNQYRVAEPTDDPATDTDPVTVEPNDETTTADSD